MVRLALFLGLCLLTATCSSDDAPRGGSPVPEDGGAGSPLPGGGPGGAGAGGEHAVPKPDGGVASASGGAPADAGGAGAEVGGGAAGADGEGGSGLEPPAEPDDGCSSGLYRYPDDSPGEGMNPGIACLACHAVSTGTSAPNLIFAGTLYPTAIEPNSCMGVAAAGAEVVLVDASSVEHRAFANASGNFLSRVGLLTPPYSAKVVFNGAERVAQTAHTGSGDCNSCHSPGARIRLPAVAP